ncbi:alpha-galactosidase [Rugosimonospora africana]|nr:alpha-galactosidase [Rugosimonospora africana]
MRIEDGAEAATVHVTASVAETTLVRLDVPLGDAVGYWHPSADWERPLPADWEGDWRRVGLVESAALGCLYDSAGRSLLAFASDRTDAVTWMRFGVSESRARYGVWLATRLAAGEGFRLCLRPAGPSAADTVRALARWLTPVDPMPTPEAARTPAYSTWYSMHRAVSADLVEADAAVAAELGCGVLLLDDGWQANADVRGYSGCGDWVPDPAKFPDFAAHVAAVRARGLRYVAWIAPLLLGERSTVHDTLVDVAPRRAPRLDCRILDPRQDKVRAFVVDSCVRLVDRYGLDGLKVDFLDQAMAYADDTAHNDTAGDNTAADVGQATRALLVELRERLHAVRGDDLLIELRQPYAGPAMRAYGNLLRASDCPADASANRLRTRDIAVLAPGAAVHCDMLMWDPAADVDAAARQVQSALYSVPQISVRLAGQSAGHRAMTAWWLRFWLRYRDVLLDGQHPASRLDERAGTVTASAGNRAVVTVFGERRVVPLDPGRFTEIALVNSTAAGHVVVDVTGTARARLTVMDSRGRPAGTHLKDLSPGLHRLPVPPAGLCVIEHLDGAATGAGPSPESTPARA